MNGCLVIIERELLGLLRIAEHCSFWSPLQLRLPQLSFSSGHPVVSQTLTDSRHARHGSG